MLGSRRRLWTAASVTVLAVFLSGCHEDEKPPRDFFCDGAADCASNQVCLGGECVQDGFDVGGQDDVAPPGPATPCTPCRVDADCGRASDVCLSLRDGSFCTRDCRDDPTPCPDATTCVAVTDSPAHEGALQCVPEGMQCGDCVDADGDGYGSGAGCRGADCDDRNNLVHPDATEACNGEDDNCDGVTDEGFDLDSPAHCGGCNATCALPNVLESDCVEGACTVVSCAGEFADCDGEPSNGCEVVERLFFRDFDGDGYGRDEDVMRGCAPVEGYVERGGDCDDLDEEEHPGAGEVCDDLDNDCDAAVDEVEDLDAPPAGRTSGVCAGLRQECNGFLFVEPDYLAVEHYEDTEFTCDGRDNDCDGETDEDCPACTVPFRYPTAQAAADARCTEVFILEGAPRIVSVRNPPEDIAILGIEDGIQVGFIEVRLDEGNPRSVRVEGLSAEGFSAINVDRQGSIELRRLDVREVESNIPMGTVAGFNITVASCDFVSNVVTTGSRTGVLSVSEARNFRVVSNVFRGNRIDANAPSAVAGALYIEGDLSEGLIAGNLFASNVAHGPDAGGALYAALGVRNIRLFNNTFVRNENSENVQATSVRCAGQLPGSDFRNNVIWFGPGRHIDGCQSATIAYSNHENGVPDGEGNLSIDPRFEEERDYWLADGSPCVDRGDPLEVHQDLDATRNDMGYTGGPYLP